MDIIQLRPSQSVEWGTPPDLFAALNARFAFTLDAAASDANHKCPRYFTRESDGLAQPWTGRVWINPPYGRCIRDWIRKAVQETDRQAAELVVVLVPARCDTQWWHDHVMKRAHEVWFIRGRLSFTQPGAAVPSQAPFPVALIIFRSSRRRGKLVVRSCSQQGVEL